MILTSDQSRIAMAVARDGQRVSLNCYRGIRLEVVSCGE